MQVQVTRTSGHQSTVEYKSLAQEVQELLCPDKPRIVYEGVTYDLVDFTETSQNTSLQLNTHHVTLDSQATGVQQMTATAMPHTPKPGYYFADNSNNDTTKVYYGAFESELECKCYKAFHSNTNEEWACVEYYDADTLKTIEDDPGRATWTFTHPSKAEYPTSLDTIQDYANQKKSSHSTHCQVDTHSVTLDSHQQTGETQMTATATTRTISHPNLQYLASADFGVLPSDLAFLDVPESTIATMTHDELEDAVFFLDEGGYDHTTAWNKLYAQYRNDAYLASRGVMRNQPTITPEEKPMPAKVATTKKQAKELFTQAAQDNRIIAIIEDLLMDEAFDATLTDDLTYAVQEYIALPDKDNKRFLHETSKTAGLKLPTDFCKSVENSPAFQTLLGEYLSKVPQHQTIVATDTTAEAIANESKPTKPKGFKPATANPKLPMPSIDSIEALESMSRKELIDAMKAINSNTFTGIRANAASVTLKEAICSHLMGVDYVAPLKPAKEPKAPKTPKAAKVAEIIALPEGLSWDECKGMKYRQLQQVCKALRSQGLFSGNIGGKGATTENLLKGCADYFRSQGVDIQEVSYKAQSTKELHLPNFAKIVEDKRLERETTAALKLNNSDAKVALEMAVAA